MKNKKKKIIINLVIFILLMLLLFYFVFKNIDLKKLILSVEKANFGYLGLGIFIMACSLFFEGVNIHICLNSFGYKRSILNCLKYAGVGFFFSGITPSSTGGQPMQIYYMYKDKVPVSCATILLILILTGYIVATLILTVLGLFIDAHFISTIGYVKIFIYLGIIINFVGFILCMILMFSKKLSTKFGNFIIKILNKFKYKKVEQVKEKINNEISIYQNTAEHIKNKKWLILICIFLNLLELIGKFSIPYFVYRAFGLNEFGYVSLVLLESLLFIATAILPSPGAMGVSEGGFLILFKRIFKGNYLTEAMLLNRFISFYLFIFLIGIFLFIEKFLKTNKRKKC